MENASENTTAEGAQFAIQFVIDAALKLQEFDWTASPDDDDA